MSCPYLDPAAIYRNNMWKFTVKNDGDNKDGLDIAVAFVHFLRLSRIIDPAVKISTKKPASLFECVQNVFLELEIL